MTIWEMIMFKFFTSILYVAETAASFGFLGFACLLVTSIALISTLVIATTR